MKKLRFFGRDLVRAFHAETALFLWQQEVKADLDFFGTESLSSGAGVLSCVLKVRATPSWRARTRRGEGLSNDSFVRFALSK
jgi:hypothetical protein